MTDIHFRASYRSLLDTAETIIDMEVRMEHVESKLSRVGQNCNSRGLDRVTTNANKMDTHNRGRGMNHMIVYYRIRS